MKSKRRTFIKNSLAGLAGLSMTPCLFGKSEPSNDSIEILENDDRIVFSNNLLELNFDRYSGRWVHLIDRIRNKTIINNGSQEAPIVLIVNGETTVKSGRSQWWSLAGAEEIGMNTICSNYTINKKEGLLVLHTREADWFIDQIYRLRGERLERGLKITYLGDKEALLRGIEFNVPPGNLGPASECFVEAPGYPVKAHQPLTFLASGLYWDKIKWDPGSAADAPGQRAIVC